MCNVLKSQMGSTCLLGFFVVVFVGGGGGGDVFCFVSTTCI